MKKAFELGRKRSATGADQKWYHLSEPMPIRGWNEEANESTEYVLVSATVAFDWGEPETFIFPCTKDGEVTDWGELTGSFRGDLDHVQALLNAGYHVVKKHW